MPRFLGREEALGWPGPRINAGDASTILHESPFETAYKLYLYKTKKWPRPPQTAAMRSGNETEPYVFAWYREQMGFDGESQAWAAMDDCEAIQGKSDWWTGDRKHLAEFKSPSRDDSADHILARDGHVIPYHYQLQCWHLYEVFDAESMNFVSWRSKDDNVIIPVERNTEFWLVEMLPRYMEYLGYLETLNYPRPQGEELVEDDEEFQMWARRYCDAKAMEREAKELLDRSKAGLARRACYKVTSGCGIKAIWTEYKPRYEVKVSVDTQQMATQVEAALQPLKERGIRVARTDWPPNLTLRISTVKEGKEE